MALKQEFIWKYTDTVEEMSAWLNTLLEDYEAVDEPHLSSDLRSCVVSVWIDKDTS